MSCVDLMYQPYAPYFPYQPASLPPSTEPFKKYRRLHEAADTGGHYGIPSHISPHHGSSSASPPTGLSSHLSIKEESSLEKRPNNTQYLTDKCVLLTYFSGDVASHVDEHFSRALSQPSAFTAENQGSKPPGNTSSWKDTSMSQRKFPESFWNSSYQPTPSHHDLSALGAESYMASSLHSVSGLHTQDPWRYPLTSQAHTYSHPSVHDLAYPAMATSSRYSHYGSLLPAAAAAGRLGASQCELSKHHPGDSWGSRYHSTDPLSASAALGSAHDSHLHSALPTGGIDGMALQDTSKDSMYWF